MNSDVYGIESYGNGEEALKFMNENSFNMLITDVYMPLMNGMEINLAVRESISVTIPILTMSTSHEGNLVAKLFNTGGSERFCYETFSCRSVECQGITFD